MQDLQFFIDRVGKKVIRQQLKTPNGIINGQAYYITDEATAEMLCRQGKFGYTFIEVEETRQVTETTAEVETPEQIIIKNAGK
jgi:hypothetical protein